MQSRSVSGNAGRGGILAAVLFLLIAGISPASARPNIRLSFFNEYSNAVGTQLDNLPSISGHCGVCHYAFTGGGPKNPYGERLAQVLPNYPNTDNGRRQAIRSIRNEDSDGDGFTQLTEITDTQYVNVPTFPGLTPANVGNVSAVDPADILGYLVPVTQVDSQPPQVVVVSPNGGEAWEGGSSHLVQWTATDNVGVVSIDIFYRDLESAPWTQIAAGLANSGSFVWFVQNTPTTQARVMVRASDAMSNQGSDTGNAVFTIAHEPGGIVPTTLRDFHQPGTQPFGGGVFQGRTACSGCHGGYDPAVEPDFNFRGSMMAQAARDPLFYAAVAVAGQDAVSSGDLCLRCHTPIGWLSGRSNPTDGSGLIQLDREGVTCDFCHRVLDPDYTPGVDPAEDAAILGALAEVPGTHGNGQYVVDPEARKRGPFNDAVAPHSVLYSPFHRSADFCGTCHDVSNPAFDRTGPADYVPGPLDAPADSIDPTLLYPVERTYSEWRHSAYPGGVYAPEFAGNKPDGIVSTCQDCHMHDVSGRGCNDLQAPIRPDLPLHDMTGGNSWMPPLVEQLYPGEVDQPSLSAASARATSLLQKAASLDLALVQEGDSTRADVTVTNQTGHRLPTGYPEGRRMWIHLQALDSQGSPVYESGAYDPSTGVLVRDSDLVIYEAEMGISPGLAGALGVTPGISFHFVLNDSIYKDNRIPPRGFTNAGFQSFGGTPVDPDRPGTRYADGQYWDTSKYHLPASARTVRATLYYQTTSKDMVEFLRDQNTSNDAGRIMHDLWAANGRAAPVAMAADTAAMDPLEIAEPVHNARLDLRIVRNPAGERLELEILLPASSDAVLQVFDLQGREVEHTALGLRGPGLHRLSFETRTAEGRPLRAGVYWVRLKAAEASVARRVVILD